MSEQTTKAPSRRRQNRIVAMQFLYAYEINRPDNLNEAMRAYFESFEQERDFYAFAEELVQGTIEHLDALDKRITSHASNWSFNRIAKVDLAILRLAAYEMLYRDDIPPVVTINEAVDLSKEFSADDSRRFINGVLDRIRADLTRPSREPNL